MKKEPDHRRAPVDNAGFSLIEVVIAMLILVMVIMGFIPVYVFASQLTQRNRVKLIATQLASDYMEEIRAMRFSDVGWVENSSVSGVLVQSGPNATFPDQQINGAYYTVQPVPQFDQQLGLDALNFGINIGWAANNVAANYFPAQYKKVDVRVVAYDINTGKYITSAYVHTIVTPEGEQSAYTGANIWIQTQQADGDIVPDVGASLIAGAAVNASSMVQSTDETGRTLFPGLAYGFYTGTAYTHLASDPDWMMRPDQVEEQSPDLEKSDPYTMYFEVDHPCHLNLSLVSANDTSLAVTSGKVILITPYGPGNISQDIATGGEGALPIPLWPVGNKGETGSYDIKVLADGYLPCLMSAFAAANPSLQIWNGQFKAPTGDTGDTEHVRLQLIPAAASVQVTDQGTRQPVVGAQVEVDLNQYTCTAQATGGLTPTPAQWSTTTEVFDTASDAYVPTSTGKAVYAVTDELGVASFDKNILPPNDANNKGYSTLADLNPDPALNDTYYSYVVTVTQAATTLVGTTTYGQVFSPFNAAHAYNVPISAATPYDPKTSPEIGAPIGMNYPFSLSPNFSLLSFRVEYNYTGDTSDGILSSGYPRYGVVVQLGGNTPQSTSMNLTPGELIFNNPSTGATAYSVYRQGNSTTSLAHGSINVGYGANFWTVNF